MKNWLSVIKNWLMRIRSAKFLTAGFVHFGNALFWIIFVLLSVGALWYAGAFFRAFDLPAFAAWTAVIMLLVLLAASLFFWRLLPLAALLELTVFIWFYSITPQERFRGTVWQRPWQRTFQVRRLDDGRFELYNVRDFRYRSEHDYEVRYRTLRVDPEQISSIDAVFSHWDNMVGIAHSLLGLNFSDGTTIVISLETRLPKGAEQNAVDGFYHRYELAMLAGTPEDFYGLRADHRGETLYVFRLDVNHDTLRGMTLSVFERAAELQQNPKFYNSLFRNCTTGLLPMLPGADQLLKGDFRLTLNGLAPSLLFDKKLLVCREGESYGSLRSRSLVPGLCLGKNAPVTHYRGESEARWLRKR